MKHILTLLFAYFLIQPLMAQENYLSLALSKNNLGLPFGNLFQPTLGAGLEIGWIKPFKDKEKRFIRAYTGGYFKSQDSGLYLGAEFLNRYPLNERLTLGFSYGLAYLHSFNLNQVYSINQAPDWQSGGHGGSPSALIRLGAIAEYQVADQYRIVLRLIEGLQIPYTRLIGGTTRSSLQLGLMYQL